MRPAFSSAWVILAIVSFYLRAQAQWQTQEITLQPGWNGVYLHVAATHETIDTLLATGSGAQIDEIWAWNPALVISPSNWREPSEAGRWSSWVRTNKVNLLNRLAGNTAYVVKSRAAVVWRVKGAPLPPKYEWTTSGANFIGFPADPSRTLTLGAFLSAATNGIINMSELEVYRYSGSPQAIALPVLDYGSATLKRGEAYWIRCGDLYNRYFGPFQVSVDSPKGLVFGDRDNVTSFRVSNGTANALNLSLVLKPSEPDPSTGVDVAVPPLVVRGEFTLSKFSHGYTNLEPSIPMTLHLAPAGQVGSEVEVVLGLNRSRMFGQAGQLLAGILELKDSLGYLAVDVPVSATISSSAGLWVGNALVTQVGQYLNTYQAQNSTLAFGTSTRFYANAVDGIFAADLENRGRDSLLLLSAYNKTLTILTNNGQGGFLVWTNLPTGNSPATVAAADLRGSGYRDLILANAGDRTLSIFTNNFGTGFGLKTNLALASMPSAIVVADINNDNRIDLIVESATARNLVVLLNDGQANFRQVSSLALNNAADRIAAADVDGNGSVDLITAGAAGVLVLTNTGSNTFLIKTNIALGFAPGSLAAAELFHPGISDLVVGPVSGTDLAVLANSGAGSFAPLAGPLQRLTEVVNATNGVDIVAVPQGYDVAGAVVRDINGDGFPDLVCPSSTDAELIVFTNNAYDGFIETAHLATRALSDQVVITSINVQTDTKLDFLARSATNHWLDLILAGGGDTELAINAQGQRIKTGTSTRMASVAQPFQLRLILHNPTNGNAVLLHHVFCGLDAWTNQAVVTREGSLSSEPGALASARRISAPHLPWTAANHGWDCSGRLDSGASLAVTVTEDFTNQASNPFLHTYHPDHDNLDVRFENPLLQGQESYTFRREISLAITPPSNDFEGLTGGSSVLTGNYSETLSLLGLGRSGGSFDTRQFKSLGVFSLTRISTVPTLTR